MRNGADKTKVPLAEMEGPQIRRCIILYTADPDYVNTPAADRPERRREHQERVLALSDFLVRHGVDCMLDRYVVSPDPPDNWKRWVEEEIETRDSVILILTPFSSMAYAQQAMPTDPDGKGLLVAGGLTTGP